MWSKIDLPEFIKIFNQYLASYGLPVWKQQYFSRDDLAQYCSDVNRPYICKGSGFPWARVNMKAIHQEAKGWTSPREVESELIDHEKNKFVFNLFLNQIRSYCEGSIYLWSDDSILEVESDEAEIFQIDIHDWSEFCKICEASQLCWMSFCFDKVLFSPKFEIALVIFHHDCLELAGIASDPEILWDKILKTVDLPTH
ncbi:MAG: hypothetical protein ACFFCZ_00250 [Promethearchaeota archaeon]